MLGGGGVYLVAASVSCWRRLILEGDGNMIGGGGLASNTVYVKMAVNIDEVRTT